jgi:cytochrome c553
MLRPLLLASALALALPSHAAPPFRDDMAQRTLACTACHGKEGRAAPDGYYPRIAGKPAGYLYNQLLHFRDGRRHYGLMTRLVDTLSDEYLLEIARHFASLDLPYPPPAAQRAPAEALQRGRQLALQGDLPKNMPACAQCHGRALTGVLPNVPGLLGLPRDYLNAQLGAWRAGKRNAHAPDCMAEIAQRLQPDDLSAVTAWLASQPVPRNAKPVPPPRQPLPLACGSAALPAGPVR